MKLVWRITLRVFVVMLVILPVWGFFFYRAVVNEVNDEIDDNLELYAENLIRRFLTDRNSMPPQNNGTNNTYFIKALSDDSEFRHGFPEFTNEMVYVQDKLETEPARIMKTVFVDGNSNRFLLTVLTPTVESKDLIEAILHWVLLLFATMLIVLVAIISIIFTDSMRPLYRLLKWIDSYRLGENMTPLVNKTSIMEFRKLNEALTRFSKRNEDMYQQQKQFIGNASHEIQTPIAVCLNRLEMLCETPLSESQLNEVIKTRNSLQYMARLNKALLLLTKIENGQFNDAERVNITEIARKNLEDLEEIYSYRNIRIDFSNSGSDLEANINPTLATILVTNLIKNSFVHNIDNGNISIDISDRTFKITNTATEGPLDKLHIFDRFYQGRRREGSTGLGLAIAKAITVASGEKINYSYTGSGHCFSIYFK